MQAHWRGHVTRQWFHKWCTEQLALKQTNSAKVPGPRRLHRLNAARRGLY
jgi:hypothetical protein